MKNANHNQGEVLTLAMRVARRRAEENAEIVRRLRAGDHAAPFDAMASWYPPRPITKKDAGEIARTLDPEAK